MKFTELWARNFLSIGDQRIRVVLNKRGLVLVEGENLDDPSARSNGAGKSALPEAILWCLYGITARGYSADEVVNRKTGQDCEVEVCWEDDGGKQHHVQRYRKHSTVRPTNLLHYVVNGSSETCPNVNDTQAKITSALGMSAETFMQTVIFGQTAAYRFSTLTDKEQKEILDEALGIEAYARACDLARSEARSHETALVLAQSRKITLDGNISKAETALEEAEDSESKFEERKQEKVRELRARFVTSKQAVIDCEAEASSLEDLEDELATMKAHVKEAHGVVQESEKEYSTLEAERNTARNGAQDMTEQAVEAGKTSSGKCRVCGQKIDGRTLKTHIAELNVRAADFEDAAKRRGKKMAEVRDRLALEKSEVTKLDEEANAFERTKVLKARNASARLPTLTKQRDRDLEALKQAKKEENPYGAIAQRAREDIEDAKAERKSVQAQIDEHSLEVRKYGFWIEAFGPKGIRSLLIDTALPFLNKQAETYARVLTDGAISVEFKTQATLKSGKTSERFEVSVANEHGADSYKGNSAGEKAKIDLIVGLSLQALVANRAAAQVNVAWFDEVFESLDATALDRAIQLLTNVSSKRPSVFVITHREELAAYFPTTMRVVKEHGESRIET